MGPDGSDNSGGTDVTAPPGVTTSGSSDKLGSKAALTAELDVAYERRQRIEERMEALACFLTADGALHIMLVVLQYLDLFICLFFNEFLHGWLAFLFSTCDMPHFYPTLRVAFFFTCCIELSALLFRNARLSRLFGGRRRFSSV